MMTATPPTAAPTIKEILVSAPEEQCEIQEIKFKSPVNTDYNHICEYKNKCKHVLKYITRIIIL